MYSGRGERIRTFDPLVPNQMRYQAALRPDSWILTAAFCGFRKATRPTVAVPCKLPLPEPWQAGPPSTVPHV